jgi:superfamily II DNA/RNA helicase
LNSFQELQLPSALARAVLALDYIKPTPIQSQAIPLALQGKDLIACAQTGTGKTAAFCLPALSHLLESQSSTALILAPTRELVQQIEQHWISLARYCGIGSVSIIGGASMHAQVRNLAKKPRAIIATPGRLLDHLRRRSINVSSCGILVLDEADRMLDMGFAPQLNEILRYVPQQRQTMLFTATWPVELDKLVQKYLRTPARVTVGKASQAATMVNQSLIATTIRDKNDTLLDEINRRPGSVLVFARTKSRTDRVTRFLSSYGVTVSRIHGGRSQGQRNMALAGFKSGEFRVLVATDIAARGIDVKDIAHVINYDLPMVAEDYVHRIGRTGRAGASGTAVSFITPDDRSQWHEIARLLKRSGSPTPSLASFG